MNKLTQLRSEHQQLEKRLLKLSKRLSLTEAEHQEKSELQKLKLLKKDKIAALEQGHK